jgi:hypothetical protein
MPAENINLYLVNGDSDGLRIATIANWDGKAFAAPRTDLKELLIRKEMGWAGIYFLLGQNDQTGDLTVYIGVAKLVRNRLANHGEKDWTHIVVFVSESLHEGHVKHLEGCVLEEAKKLSRYKVTNDKGSGSPLPEHECANMEVFLSRIRLLLPILGCDLLVPIAQHKEGKNLICKIKGLVAYGQRSPQGFVVFKGSQGITELRHSAKTRGGWIINLRKKLDDAKVLIADGDHLVFAKDYEFASPSAAAAVIRGGNANGLTEWKSEDGKTLRELETAAIFDQLKA